MSPPVSGDEEERQLARARVLILAALAAVFGPLMLVALGMCGPDMERLPEERVEVSESHWGDDGFFYVDVEPSKGPPQRCDNPEPECTGPGHPIWYCMREHAPPLPDGDDMRGRLTFEDFDLVPWLERHPERRAEVVRGLRTCIAEHDGRSSAAGTCLQHYATLDREAALQLATSLDPPWARSLGQALGVLRKPPGWLGRQLVRVGLLDEAAAAELRALTVHGALGVRGQLFTSDMETGEGPPGNDLFIESLARTGELAHACYTERIEEGAVVLRGCLDGECWQAQAPDFGDWLNVDLVTGLLNTMLAAKGASRRCLKVAMPHHYGGQSASVACADGAALRSAVEQELLFVLEGPLKRRYPDPRDGAVGGWRALTEQDQREVAPRVEAVE